MYRQSIIQHKPARKRIHTCIETDCGARVSKPRRRCQTHAQIIRNAKRRAARPPCHCGAPRFLDMSVCQTHARELWRAQWAARHAKTN